MAKYTRPPLRNLESGGDTLDTRDDLAEKSKENLTKTRLKPFRGEGGELFRPKSQSLSYLF